MNFNDKASVIADVAKKELKNIEINSKEEIKKIDKEYLDKMDTELSSISQKTIYNGAKTIRDVIEFAKKERKQLLMELRNCSYDDTEKQLKINSKLLEINKLLSSQEKAFENKENEKFNVISEKKLAIANSMLVQLIENVDKEIQNLENKIKELGSKISNLYGTLELNDYLKELGNSNEKMVEFSKLKQSLIELKTYNGTVDSQDKILELTKGLKAANANLVKNCYGLITNYYINMNSGKKIINNNNDDDLLKEINDLLAKADKDLDEKALDEAVKLIKTLPEGEDKEDLQAEAAEINEKINKSKKGITELELATSLVKKAEDKKTYTSIDKAYVAVKALPDSAEKTELLDRLNKLVISITEEFMDMVKKAEEKVKNIGINSYDLVSNEEVNKIKEIFNELYEKEIPKIGFKKSEYGKKVTDIIFKYNMQEQNNYKNNLEVELDKKGKVKKPFSNWQIVTEFSTLIETKLANKYIERKNSKIQSKIDALKGKTTSEKEKEKLKKYESKKQRYGALVREMDIVNTPRLFMARNKIASLKPKLYKSGIDGLDDKEAKKYIKSTDLISNKLCKALFKKIDSGKAVKDELRVKTVISQALELLSICPEKVEIKNFFGKVVKKYDKEEIIEKINQFLLDAYSEKSILPEEYQAYHDELWNIVLYHKEVDQYYEIPSVDYNDNGLKYHDELDDKTVEYYKTPISYTDENKETNIIPYVKKSRK